MEDQPRQSSVSQTLVDTAFRKKLRVELEQLGLFLCGCKYHRSKAALGIKESGAADVKSKSAKKYLRELHRQMRKLPNPPARVANVVAYFESGAWKGDVSLKEALDIAGFYDVPRTMVLPLAAPRMDARGAVYDLPQKISPGGARAVQVELALDRRGEIRAPALTEVPARFAGAAAVEGEPPLSFIEFILPEEHSPKNDPPNHGPAAGDSLKVDSAKNKLANGQSSADAANAGSSDGQSSNADVAKKDLPDNCGKYFFAPARLPKTELAMAFMRLEPGELSEQHSHPGSEIAYIVRGCATLHLQNTGDRIILKEGDLAHFSSDGFHYLEHHASEPGDAEQHAEILSLRFLMQKGGTLPHLQYCVDGLQDHFKYAFGGLIQKFQKVVGLSAIADKYKSKPARRRSVQRKLRALKVTKADLRYSLWEMYCAREQYEGPFNRWILQTLIGSINLEGQHIIADPIGLGSFLRKEIPDQKQSLKKIALDAKNKKATLGGFVLNKDQFRRLQADKPISEDKMKPFLMAYLSKVIRTAPSAIFAQFLFPPVSHLLVLRGDRVEEPGPGAKRKCDYDWQLLDESLTSAEKAEAAGNIPELIFRWRTGETFFFPRRHLATADISVNLVKYEAYAPVEDTYGSHKGLEFVILRSGKIQIDFQDLKDPNRKPLKLENPRQFALFDSSVGHKIINTSGEEACALVIRFFEETDANAEKRPTQEVATVTPL